jgi:uncharacterized membrane protein
MIFSLFLFIALYTFIAGVAGRQVNAIGTSKCNKKIHDWEKCGHYYTGIIAGLFWPIALPLAAGMKTGEEMPTPINKALREENSRKKELADKQHQAQLDQAELMAEEMLGKRLELGIRRMELESKRLELTAKGVADFEEEGPSNNGVQYSSNMENLTTRRKRWVASNG